MILHRRASLFTLPVVALLSVAGCSLPQAVRDAGAPLSDDRLVPAPEAQAFFTAARRGDVAGLRAGLATGLDVNLAEPLYGRTALMRAAAFDHLAATQALVAAGGDARAKDFDGDTVLHIVAAAGAVKVIAVLLKAGAEIDAQREREGWTALAMAVDAGQVVAVRALLAAGANANLAREGELAPLEQAIRLADAALVDALLRGKASLVPSKSAHNASASLLHMAIDNVQDGDPAVVALLLKAGADARTRDEHGRTPFERAVELASRAGFAAQVAPTVAAFRAAGVTR